MTPALSEQSPLARLVVFMICLSVAGALFAGALFAGAYTFSVSQPGQETGTPPQNGAQFLPINNNNDASNSRIIIFQDDTDSP